MCKLTGHWFGTRGLQMDYYYRMGSFDIASPGDEPTRTPFPTKGDGKSQAVFTATLPKTGRYQVAIAYPASTTSATNVPVTISTADGDQNETINQKATPPFAFSPLGEFKFDADKPAQVTVTDAGADGRIGVDAIRFIWVANRPG